MDTEWAIDGLSNKLFIVQARPETIHSNITNTKMIKYNLLEKSNILLPIYILI